MNIMELGAIREFVSGLAVIGSLIYVGLQVRQSTQTTRAASHHATIDSFREWSRSIIEDDEIASIYLKGNADQANLSEPERIQYTLLLFALLRIYETLYYQNRLGTGERELLRSEEVNMRVIFSEPGVQQWWREQPFALDGDFRQYIDSLVPASSAPNAEA